MLADLNRQDEALTLLRSATAAPGAGAEDWARLGELQARGKDYAAAADSYGRAVALRPTPPRPEDWIYWFLRGSAREQAGNWQGAEADLRQALALRPNDATVLNYLGYSMLDRGRNLPEATRLIERAAALQPDNGAILDSLGWAYFRTGRTAEAVARLEQAAAAEPGDPTITAHLGDAYWAAGRRLEARYKWRAALELGPTDKDKADLLAKLDQGPADALAAAAPAS